MPLNNPEPLYPELLEPVECCAVVQEEIEPVELTVCEIVEIAWFQRPVSVGIAIGLFVLAHVIEILFVLLGGK